MTTNAMNTIRLLSTGSPERTELEAGVLLERRLLLWLPVLVAASLVSPGEALAEGRGAPVEGAMTWDDFVKECNPKAADLYKDSSREGQDAYLYWIASMAARLTPHTIPEAKLGKFKDLSPTVEFGVGYRGVPFFVVEWKMSPNAYLPPHNHPNASVCTVALEGEARIRNFETVGNAPEFSSSRSFNVRETHNEVISAGRINTLSARRDNIHTFQVGEDGARGIDISTYHGENIGFSFLDIQEKPIDAKRRVFEANWKSL